MKQFKGLVRIVGREWFRRSCGGTYQTFTITDGPEVLYIEESYFYGYGDYYLEMAFKKLAEMGYFSTEQHDNGCYHDYGGAFRDMIHADRIVYYKKEVRRMKDL